MEKTILGYLFLAVILIISSTALARYVKHVAEPIYIQETKVVKVEVPVRVEVPVLVKASVYYTKMIEEIAEEYGTSAKEMIAVVACESGFNARAIGDHGQSYGLSQIHLPSHPHVSVEQATSADFALRFMAQEFKRDNKNIWTCYRNLKAKGIL